jgi:transcriptional/translational regulatory protein YebC/TACO1
MELSKEDTLKVLRVVEALDEMDDTEHIFHNMAVSDEIYEEMEE